jgi:hypothetical protein
MTAPVRIAVAGAGLIGRRHIEEVDASSSVQLAAIVDPFPAAQEVADTFGVTLYGSLAELFAVDRPDGVILATPNQLHVDGGLECVAAGVPVIVEKPDRGHRRGRHAPGRGGRGGRRPAAHRTPPQLQPDHGQGPGDRAERHARVDRRRRRHGPVLQAG